MEVDRWSVFFITEVFAAQEWSHPQRDVSAQRITLWKLAGSKNQAISSKGAASIQFIFAGKR
jgi:hypothetical protein